MKSILTLLLYTTCLNALLREYCAHRFYSTGEVKNPQTITMAALSEFKSKDLNM
jgi:hypothetical protein